MTTVAKKHMEKRAAPTQNRSIIIHPKALEAVEQVAQKKGWSRNQGIRYFFEYALKKYGQSSKKDLPAPEKVPWEHQINFRFPTEVLDELNNIAVEHRWSTNKAAQALIQKYLIKWVNDQG